jgi:hypothetical protein
MPLDAFLKFRTDADCSRFLASLREADAELAGHLRRARTLPVLRARHITEEDYRWLEIRLGKAGEIFRDVQFDSFGEA